MESGSRERVKEEGGERDVVKGREGGEGGVKGVRESG